MIYTKFEIYFLVYILKSDILLYLIYKYVFPLYLL